MLFLGEILHANGSGTLALINEISSVSISSSKIRDIPCEASGKLYMRGISQVWVMGRGLCNIEVSENI